MNIHCPSCNKLGTEQDFVYTGTRKLQCKFCRKVVEVALRCPKCDSMIIENQKYLSKSTPLASFIRVAKANAEVVCPNIKCGYSGYLLIDFPLLLFYEGNVTVNK
jgi:hypothetical protein